MRSRRRFDLHERVGLAILLGRFLGVDRRAGDEFEVDAGRHVTEQDFAVIRVDAFFHDVPWG